jgi:hypothetical protein
MTLFESRLASFFLTAWVLKRATALATSATGIRVFGSSSKPGVNGFEGRSGDASRCYRSVFD